jgi:hypothetical protein
MLAFGRTVRDEEAIFDTRLERLSAQARHFGFHAANVLAVYERPVYRNGVGVGDQMPERQAVFIGLPFVQRDDFEFREFVWPAKFENDRNCRRIGIGISGASNPGDALVSADDVNDLWCEPVGEIKNVDTGKRKRGENEKPAFFSHKIFECGGRMICLIKYQDARTE